MLVPDTKPAFLTTTKRRPSRLLPTSKRHGPHSDETSSDASEISLKHSRSDDDDSRSPSPKRKCKKSKTFRSPSPPPPETVSATKLRGKHRSQNRPQRKTPRIEDCVSVDPTDWKDFLIIVLKAFGFSPLERLLDYKGLSQVSADEIALQEMQLGTELSTDNIYIIRDRDGQKRKEKLTDFFNEIKNSPMNFVPVPNAGGDSPRICMIQMFGGDCGDDGITCPEQDSSPQTNGSFFGCLFGNFGGGNGCNGSNGCKCNGSSGGCNGGGCSGYSSGGCSGAAGGFFSGGSSGCGSAGCGSSSTYSYTPCRRCGNNLTKCTCFSTVKLLSEKGALGRTTPAQLIDPVLPSTKRPSDGSETKESFILQDAAGTGQMLAAATASPPNPQGSSTGSALGVTVVNDVTDVSNTIENETNTDHNLRTTALSVTMKEKQAQQLSPKLVAAKKGEEKHPFCKEWTPTSCEEEGKAKKGGGGSGGDGSGGAGKRLKPELLTMTRKRAREFIPVKSHEVCSNGRSSDASEIAVRHSGEERSRSPPPKRKSKKSKKSRSPSSTPPETAPATKPRGKRRSQNRPQYRTPTFEDYVSVDPSEWKNFFIMGLKALGFISLSRFQDGDRKVSQELLQLSTDPGKVQGSGKLRLTPQISPQDIYIVREKNGQKEKERLSDFFDEIKRSNVNFVSFPEGDESPRICMVQMFGSGCDFGITCPGGQDTGAKAGCSGCSRGGSTGSGCYYNPCGSGICRSGKCTYGGCGSPNSFGSFGICDKGASTQFSAGTCLRCRKRSECSGSGGLSLSSGESGESQLPILTLTTTTPSSKPTKEGARSDEASAPGPTQATPVSASATSESLVPTNMSHGEEIPVSTENSVTQPQQPTVELLAAKKAEQKHPFCKEWTPTSCEEEGKAKKGGGGSGGDGSGGAGKHLPASVQRVVSVLLVQFQIYLFRSTGVCSESGFGVTCAVPVKVVQMVLFLFLLLGVGYAAFVLYQFYKQRVLYRFPPAIPTSRIWTYVRNERSSKPSMRWFLEMAVACGPVISLNLGWRRIVVLNDAASIRAYLHKSNHIHGRPINIISLFNRNKGIGFGVGGKWRQRKNLCIRSFKISGMGSLEGDEIIEKDYQHFAHILRFGDLRRWTVFSGSGGSSGPGRGPHRVPTLRRPISRQSKRCPSRWIPQGAGRSSVALEVPLARVVGRIVCRLFGGRSLDNPPQQRMWHTYLAIDTMLSRFNQNTLLSNVPELE
ncbi:unnamed protein product, partial [Cyprideis torosa]